MKTDNVETPPVENPVTLPSVTVAITGASGVQYGLSLVGCLLDAKVTVHLLVSRAAIEVMGIEVGCSLWKGMAAPKNLSEFGGMLGSLYPNSKNRLFFYTDKQWTSLVASGSGGPKAMVVCPCSAGTLSAIACGASNNLIERAADVVLKERRQLIIVPREMPLSSIHLEHMLKLSNMGVVIMPASPGFYHGPTSVQDMIDFVVARVLDHLGVPHKLVAAWG
mgnify:CR=1 FL=1